MKQIQRIEKLLTRRRGATSWEITVEGRTTSPHRRMADLKKRGWIITRKDKGHGVCGVYFGVKP